MFAINIPDSWYGPNTDRMRAIIRQAKSIRWFTIVPTETNKNSSAKLVHDHLECMRQLNVGSVPNVLEVAWLRGTWHLLHQERWGTDPYHAWGDRWSASENCLGVLIRTVTQAVESVPVARSLLRPPLWPVAGTGTICGHALVAHTEILSAQTSLIPGGRDWCIAWALLCKAESLFWGALLWELALGTNAIQGANPFQPLLDLYTLGIFPMGWVADIYELYVPTL
jgi:hypothetical protein